MIKEVWLYTLISVILVSIISLIGIFTLSIKTKSLEKILIYMIAFAAGALLGDVFIHIVPELSENGFTFISSIYILFGIALGFIIEKIIRWRHCHHITCKKHPHHLSKMNLIGDSIHNFIDGIIIAISYLISIPIGIATSLAVIFHEIPQEIGDYGILIYAGYSRKKALIFNFLISLTAIIGAIITLIIGAASENLLLIILPIAAGNFIYIATADLIPELHKEIRLTQSLSQLIFFILGIAVMFLITLLEIN